MNELSDEARDLIARGKLGETPEAGARARVASALAMQVAAGSASVAPAAAKSGLFGSLAIKGLAVVAVVAASAYVVHRVRSSAHHDAPSSAPVPTVVAVASAPSIESTPSPLPSAAPEPSVVASAPKKIVASVSAPVIDADSLGSETALLRKAHAALAGGNPTEALALLHRHDVEFPHGALRPECDAERVLALCAAGRKTDARAAAQRFVKIYPRSPLAARVAGVCAD